jgi:hypothetical protein
MLPVAYIEILIIVFSNISSTTGKATKFGTTFVHSNFFFVTYFKTHRFKNQSIYISNTLTTVQS